MTGAYKHKKNDGTVCYRSRISYKGKSVSLGTFGTAREASEAYKTAEILYNNPDLTIDELSLSRFVLTVDKDGRPKKKAVSDEIHYSSLPADKVVSILNHRDNGLYIKTPVYLRKGFFSYFLKDGTELKFDTDDLFYYSSHRILNRGGSLYVNDFGMQYRILNRYGIHNFSVEGRDYQFANGDRTDMRSSNIVVINPYFGVFRRENEKGIVLYETRIHINGDFVVGSYDSVEKAAVAYNKAADYAISHGLRKKFPQNFVETITASQYATVYTEIKLSKNFMNYFES